MSHSVLFEVACCGVTLATHRTRVRFAINQVLHSMLFQIACCCEPLPTILTLKRSSSVVCESVLFEVAVGGVELVTFWTFKRLLLACASHVRRKSEAIKAIQRESVHVSMSFQLPNQEELLTTLWARVESETTSL